MRISDWSSDVCSSDLLAEISIAPLIPLAVPFPAHNALAQLCHAFLRRPDATSTIDGWADLMGMNRRTFTRLFRGQTGMSFAEWRQQACISVALPKLAAGASVTSIRSEEHTSELQSLMRISYAVFCLK